MKNVKRGGTENRMVNKSLKYCYAYYAALIAESEDDLQHNAFKYIITNGKTVYQIISKKILKSEYFKTVLKHQEFRNIRNQITKEKH